MKKKAALKYKKMGSYENYWLAENRNLLVPAFGGNQKLWPLRAARMLVNLKWKAKVQFPYGEKSSCILNIPVYI